MSIAALLAGSCAQKEVSRSSVDSVSSGDEADMPSQRYQDSEKPQAPEPEQAGAASGEGYVDQEAKTESPAADSASASSPGILSTGGDRSGKDKATAKTATTWKRSTLVANTSRLMVGDKKSLPIDGMEVNARVDGFRARVLIDFYFRNDNSQQFEGNFSVRLPEGASPYFLAFGQSSFADTRFQDKPMKPGDFASEAIMRDRSAQWIEPKVARMVPRVQAARAYTETVRRRVDPALLEWAGAGVFNTRVYPIAPNSLHRVVLGYDMNLTSIGGDLEMQLPIPAGVPSSSVHLDIAAPEGITVSVSPTAPKAQEDGRSYHSFKNVRGTIIRARLKGAGDTALTGNDYFSAEIHPQIERDAVRKAGGRAVFAVDTSLSASPERFNVYLSLMRQILTRNRGSISEFAVLFFDIDQHWWKKSFVKNTAANTADVMAFANSLALEGATDLGAALGEASNPLWSGDAGTDLFLLSDGAVTWGQSDILAVSRSLGKASLFAYRTGISGEDTTTLESLARDSGGAVFSVVGTSEIAQAAVAHNARPWRIDNIRVTGAEDVLIAGRPTTVFPGQRLIVAGRGRLESGATVELSLSRGGLAKVVSSAIKHVVESPLAGRAYGQLAVGQLEEFLGSTRPFAEAYARQFRITGKSTSLLMLESEADYQRFGIRPIDDAVTINSRGAGDVVATAIKALGDRIGNSKDSFLASVKMPAVAERVFRALPESAFVIPTHKIGGTAVKWPRVSSSVRNRLRRGKADYDSTHREAKHRFKSSGGGDALVALSSLIEANPGDAVLARDVGFAALEWGMGANAYYLFRRVFEARPDEPQNVRAMALSLADMEKSDLALAYFETAINTPWDSRFGQFHKIVMMDYIRFLKSTPAKSFSPELADYAAQRLETLKRDFGIDKADLLVTIMWNTDNTDVDLHVTEPSGEECFYSHPRTGTGGSLTQDVTQGYGPEMYVNQHAPTGNFRIRAKYFATDSNRSGVRSKVYATVYKNWGSSDEQVIRKVVTLESGKEMHTVATVKMAGSSIGRRWPSVDTIGGAL